MAFNSSAMSSAAKVCVFCRQECRPRQQSLQCDVCTLWQHRTCNTGVTQTFYRQVKRGKESLDHWSCYVCSLTESVDHLEITPLDELTTAFTRLDEDISKNLTSNEHAAPSSKTTRTPSLQVNIPLDILYTPSPTKVRYFTKMSPPASSPHPPRSSHVEDQINVLYPEDVPLPMMSEPHARSPAMPQLVSSCSSSEEELRLYLPESPLLSQFSPGRMLTSPWADSLLEWSTVTDSPLPSPPAGVFCIPRADDSLYATGHACGKDSDFKLDSAILDLKQKLFQTIDQGN